MFHLYRENGLNIPRPRYILKYRDGRSFYYLAVWYKRTPDTMMDEMSPFEVRYWRRKGVRVKDAVVTK